MWIFGYGSLLWRPDFAHLERLPGTIEGWTRRFYQGSPDHRGTPQAPGRVVTLLPEPGARCFGIAWRLDPAHVDAVLAGLDHREKAGYQRLQVEVRADDAARTEPVSALCYVAGPDNADWLGPAPLERMARQIASARGPSGSNRDYVLSLAASLRALDARDDHVFELEAALVALEPRRA